MVTNIFTNSGYAISSSDASTSKVNLVVSFRDRDQLVNMRQEKINTLIDSLLAENVIFPDMQEIKHYLFAYPDLIPIVQKYTQISKELFDNDHKFFLEVFQGSDSSDSTLTLLIRKTDYTNNSIIETLDERLFGPLTDDLQKINGWFHITTDFQPVII